MFLFSFVTNNIKVLMVLQLGATILQNSVLKNVIICKMTAEQLRRHKCNVGQIIDSGYFNRLKGAGV